MSSLRFLAHCCPLAINKPLPAGECINRYIMHDGSMGEWTNEWIDEWMDGWMDGQMDGGWMDG